MTEMTGVVERTNVKELPSGMYYSFLINDDWYRTGRDKPPFEAGYTIKFNFEDTKYGKQVDLKSVKFKEGEAPPVTTKASGGKPGSSNDFWAAKEVRDIETQKRISFNGAMNTALALVTAAFANEILTIPAKAKAEAKMDLFREMVVTEALHLYPMFQRVPDNHDTYMGVGVDVPRESLDSEEEPEEIDDW